MGRNPAFQFYPSDWQRDLDDHPLEIEGAWIRLCGRLFWTGGTSTKNLEEWARILRKNSKKTLEILLYLQSKSIGDLVIQNNEITITCRRMVRDENIRKIRTNAGAKGGNPILLAQKKDSICLTKIEPNGTQTIEQNPTPSSSSSSSSSKDKEKVCKKKDQTHPLFQQFWDLYPRKVAKPQAEKSFKKINPDETQLNVILSSLEKHKKSQQWTKDSGEYIPHPATWLNQRRWEDEISSQERPFDYKLDQPSLEDMIN